MKLLVIYAHPNNKSLNHSILNKIDKVAAKRGFDLQIRDLYALRFDPILRDAELHHGDGKVAEDVAAEQEKINWADVLIFVYPIWWYGFPAILKGWIDRVFTFGFAYGPSPQGIRGNLGRLRALIFQTAGASREKYRQQVDTLNIERVLSHGALGYCGIERSKVHTFYSTPTLDDEGVEGILKEVEASVLEL